MKFKLKKIYYNTFKAIKNSTLSRKKKIIHKTTNKIINLKLHLTTHKIFFKTLKSISVILNYKSNLQFNSLISY